MKTWESQLHQIIYVSTCIWNYRDLLSQYKTLKWGKQKSYPNKRRVCNSSSSSSVDHCEENSYGSCCGCFPEIISRPAVATTIISVQAGSIFFLLSWSFFFSFSTSWALGITTETEQRSSLLSNNNAGVYKEATIESEPRALCFLALFLVVLVHSNACCRCKLLLWCSKQERNRNYCFSLVRSHQGWLLQ